MSYERVWRALVTSFLFVFMSAGAAHAAVTVTLAELASSQLRVEGSGALPNHSIVINPGGVTGTTDASGAFRVESTPYSSPTCQITVSDGSTSMSAALSGCTPTSAPPPAPVASVSPMALTFPSQNTGTQSAAQTVTVSNTGNAPLSISTVTLAGANPGDYAKASDSCAAAAVAAGGSCAVTLTFAPVATGTRTASLTISDNAAGSPRSVSLSGTGATAPPPPGSAPAVTFTPTSVTFPAQAIGTTSAAQTVTVANTGTTPLFINSAATSGANPFDFTQVSDGCSGLTLAAGANCSVSITFSPTAAGARSGTFILTDNAAGSPQTVPLTGSGIGTTPPPVIDTRFMTCANGVCDVGSGGNVFVNNFFSTNFIASGGTSPYTWSLVGGAPPAGLTFASTGLFWGIPTVTGTATFNVQVTDATGATASGVFSITVTGSPPPSPPGCQNGGTVSEPLTGSAINNQVPDGLAVSDQTQFTACGGFSILTVDVNNVNLPDGTVLWVTLDFKPIGTITLSGGQGSINPYNLGRFSVSFNHIRVVDHPPPTVNGEPTILIGGFFS